jgi:hypothetical protein
MIEMALRQGLGQVIQYFEERFKCFGHHWVEMKVPEK